MNCTFRVPDATVAHGEPPKGRLVSCGRPYSEHPVGGLGKWGNHQYALDDNHRRVRETPEGEP